VIFNKGSVVLINHQHIGQFLARVMTTFDTEKDTLAPVQRLSGDRLNCSISACKIKPATKEQVNGI
jgi:hypothetical protein